MAEVDLRRVQLVVHLRDLMVHHPERLLQVLLSVRMIEVRPRVVLLLLVRKALGRRFHAQGRLGLVRIEDALLALLILQEQEGSAVLVPLDELLLNV